MPSQQRPPDKPPASLTPEIDPKQAALDKEAAELAAMAELEREESERLAAEAEKAAQKAEDHDEPRVPRCPDCGERMEPYTDGDVNPHKVGTAFCRKCGRRRQVRRNRVVD